MKTALTVALALALILLVFLISGTDVKRENPLISALSSMEDIKINSYKNGAQKWTLVAKNADISDEMKAVYMRSIEITLPNKSVIIEAESGRYDVDANNLTLKEGITAKVNDYTIKTGSIDFDSNGGRIGSDGRIVIEGKRLKIEGTGLRADQSQNIKILKDVKAVFY